MTDSDSLNRRCGAEENRAVVTSASYAFRGTGSTIRISICSLVFQNILRKRLWELFGGEQGAADLISRLKNNLTEIKYLEFELGREAQEVYMGALRALLGDCGKFFNEGIYAA